MCIRIHIEYIHIQSVCTYVYKLYMYIYTYKVYIHTYNVSTRVFLPLSKENFASCCQTLSSTAHLWTCTAPFSLCVKTQYPINMERECGPSERQL